MEFVDAAEVMKVLRDHGISTQDDEDGKLVFLRMEDGGASRAEVVRIHLAGEGAETEPEPGAQVTKIDAARIPDVIDGIIHKLHLSQLLLMPVAKWRNVFDAVAFSLADNEDWQAVDAAATVELNSRDPLLCEPGDFQTVAALTRALVSDAETRDQSLMLTSAAAPVLLELIPDGSLRMAFGNQALADEAAEALQAAS